VSQSTGLSKLCPRCACTKHINSYNKDRSRPDGLSFYCKTCNQADWLRQRSADPEGYRAKQARRSYRYTLRIKFGISLEDYEAKLAQQNGVCAICGQPETSVSKTGAIKALPVDHDHRTGKLRGLLCDACNKGLGAFGDDVNRLRAAIAYLQLYSE